MSAVLNVIQTLPNAEAVVVYNRLGLTSMNGQFQYSGNAKVSNYFIHNSSSMECIGCLGYIGCSSCIT